MNAHRLIGFVLLSALYSGTALSNPSIQTRIISGGEVAIMEVKARYDAQTIAVWGTGFEIFPHQTCGYPEIVFVDANGRILLRKDSVYKTSYWRRTFENRFVSFSVNIPLSTAVASVFVRHQSTEGCEHAWSLEYGLVAQQNVFAPPVAATVPLKNLVFPDHGIDRFSILRP